MCLCGDYRFTECFFQTASRLVQFLLREFLTHIIPVQSLHLQIYALKLMQRFITIDIRSSESYGCLLQGSNCWLKIEFNALTPSVSKQVAFGHNLHYETKGTFGEISLKLHQTN
jgi:hypothetical protein